MTKHKILVVDDVAILRQGTVIALTILGFDVDEAESGAEAFEKVKAGSYAAIIMDYNMPEMNGFECTEKIRAFETGIRPRTPIICMTSRDDKNIREDCLTAGLDDYIYKDCTSKDFQNSVLKWIVPPNKN